MPPLLPIHAVLDLYKTIRVLNIEMRREHLQDVLEPYKTKYMVCLNAKG